MSLAQRTHILQDIFQNDSKCACLSHRLSSYSRVVPLFQTTSIFIFAIFLLLFLKSFFLAHGPIEFE